MVFSMVAINAYLRENGLTRKCKRFSEYTRGQLRELFEYAENLLHFLIKPFSLK